MNSQGMMNYFFPLNRVPAQLEFEKPSTHIKLYSRAPEIRNGERISERDPSIFAPGLEALGRKTEESPFVRLTPLPNSEQSLASERMKPR